MRSIAGTPAQHLHFLQLHLHVPAYSLLPDHLWTSFQGGARCLASIGLVRKSGPCNHVWLWIKFFTVSPLDAKSAGLSEVFTYRHWSGLEHLRIVSTRLATNVRNLVVLLRMYFSTVVLSDQNTDDWSGSCSSDWMNLSMRAAIVAAVSSIRGTVMGLSGATLAFPNTNAQWTSSRLLLCNK